MKSGIVDSGTERAERFWEIKIGDVCPGCGGFKWPGFHFCSPCMAGLTEKHRAALYWGDGSGYGEAMENAIAFLTGKEEARDD